MVAIVKEFSSSLTITRPDDWHLHLRDGEYLKSVVGYTARQFRRALIMPNLRPPVTTVEMAGQYRDRIIGAFGGEEGFRPFMTLYLTDNTDPDEIIRAQESGFVKAVKYYPAGATTNSDSGVTDLEKVWPVFEVMQQVGMPLCVHGEVTDPLVDVFDREKEFLWGKLHGLLCLFPRLRVVVEHATTDDAVQFVLQSAAHVVATITPQHLLFNRNALFLGGVRPHWYCLPVLKRGKPHQEALIRAATSGSPKFFLGTDSAPHARHTKENDCGCAGCFSAYSALEMYAWAFAQAGALDKLEGFASFHGADFYGVPRNTEKVTLVKDEQTLPAELPYGSDKIVPLMAGEVLPWRMQLA